MIEFYFLNTSVKINNISGKYITAKNEKELCKIVKNNKGAKQVFIVQSINQNLFLLNSDVKIDYLVILKDEELKFSLFDFPVVIVGEMVEEPVYFYIESNLKIAPLIKDLEKMGIEFPKLVRIRAEDVSCKMIDLNGEDNPVKIKVD